MSSGKITLLQPACLIKKFAYTHVCSSNKNIALLVTQYYCSRSCKCDYPEPRRYGQTYDDFDWVQVNGVYGVEEVALQRTQPHSGKEL